jgi:copper(I)-binding protein
MGGGYASTRSKKCDTVPPGSSSQLGQKGDNGAPNICTTIMHIPKLSAFAFWSAVAMLTQLPAVAAPTEPLEVSDAWARATVDGQATGAAFMTLTAHADSVVVGASSPVASDAQLHEMSMSGSTMKMHQIPNLPVKAGETVKLTPMTTHVMLFGMKQTLHAGDHFPLTLSIESGHQPAVAKTVMVEVRALGQP